MKDFIQNSALVVVLAFGAFTVFDYSLSIPDVYVSYSTGNCVGVTTYQGVFFDSLGYNCENMPKKYNYINVK